MTITLDVPPDLAGKLESAAHSQGKDVATFLLDNIRQEFRRDVLSASETELLTVINSPIAPLERMERDNLVQRQRSGTLTEPDCERLKELIDAVEVANANRWTAVAELARRRGISLSEITAQLQIPLH